MATLGYRLSLEKLTAFRIHGVTPEWIAELKKLGYGGLSADDLVSTRIFQVTPEFIRSLAALYDPSPTPFMARRTTIGYVAFEMMRFKKLPAVDPNIWGPWSAARFQTEAARDGFLHSVADTQDGGWAAQAMPNEDRAAQVRWRPQRFLGLNDIAYAHGGRIVVTIVRRSVL